MEEPGGLQSTGLLESDMTERLQFHFHELEKEMATHSSVLAWRIPGTGKPSGLSSMGSHRVGHDWSDFAAAAAAAAAGLIWKPPKIRKEEESTELAWLWESSDRIYCVSGQAEHLKELPAQLRLLAWPLQELLHLVLQKIGLHPQKSVFRVHLWTVRNVELYKVTKSRVINVLTVLLRSRPLAQLSVTQSESAHREEGCTRKLRRRTVRSSLRGLRTRYHNPGGDIWTRFNWAWNSPGQDWGHSSPSEPCEQRQGDLTVRAIFRDFKSERFIYW